MRARWVGLACAALVACGQSSADRTNGAAQPIDALALRQSLRGLRALQAAPRALLPPAPIAPMSDRSGRYVMRRADSTTFFTDEGLAWSLGSAANKRWGLHCKLLGARAGSLIGDRQGTARVRDYIGALGATAMPTYERLAWEALYPGVDMVAEPTSAGVAYRFVLSPRASVSDVVMRWEGAAALRVVDEGRGLDVDTGIGTLRVRGLRAFAIDGERRTELAARHVIVGASDVGLQVDGWDGRSPLVIDPTISWSSYLGGGSSDYGLGVAVDGAGNVFVTGATQSTDFPTIGGFDKIFDGTQDAFVTKISATGTLLWSSYLGGAAIDYGRGIAVDGSGNAFVVGITQSTDFPKSGGFDTTLGGSSDAFVAKVSGAGALLWSSFLGGGGQDEATAVGVDGSGNAFIAGNTRSTDFPKNGGFDPNLGGVVDAFVTKVSGTGSLVWSSFLGGALDESSGGVAVDGAGNVFVTGTTWSADFPTSGGFDIAVGGSVDGFLTKVSGTGTLLWSSYLGGSDLDQGLAVAVDSSGNAFVTGQTQSTNFPSVGGFDTSGGGVKDAFVTKVNSAGSLVWSSYLGGSLTDYARAIAVDASGNALVAGTTYSDDFPATGGFDSLLSGTQDAFVAKVSGGGALLWSSYLGGSGVDEAFGIAVDGNGNAVLAGQTLSSDFPSTGGFDTTLGAGYDVFVTRLEFKALGTICATSSECRSAFCVEGVCCDKPCSGKCESCTATKKGSGVDGACGSIADGADPDNDCPSATCASTPGVLNNAEVCNGAGACRSNGTVSCGSFACVSGTCMTSCSSDAQCIPSTFCSGTTCIADLELGATCTGSSKCKSGFCVDSVCCESACAGPCVACSAAKKGSGVNGVCANVAADTNPRAACLAGTGTCAADGTCDGKGNCRGFAKAGTPCGATTCSGGSVTGKQCKGDSALCMDATTPCAPYVCASSACTTTCTADAECDPGAFCTTAGVCTPKLANGDACADARACGSGHCVDGVCCNAKCDGQCESCSATKGTCLPVSGDPAGTRPKCGGEPCKGRCDGFNGGTCTYPGGKVCGAMCSDATETLSRCDATGACKPDTPTSCAGYLCDGTSGCKKTCTAAGDCADRFTCRDGKCEPLQSKCSEDGLSAVSDVATTPCSPFRCDPASGACRGECRSESDCAGSFVCNSSAECVAPAAAIEDDGGCSVGHRGGSRALAALALLVALAARRRRLG